ncbi:WD40-like Beta Propeller Repeat [Ekhidna lutea]|uniref:WD40-like Beta Propeller Repeat n=1 Tax=Ekhidna lutea TaxID=447679 RepID=A0A239L571_EKHLU|nr:OmpA family protein [Ekhidna lutea]SNT24973.1 WD40-like Beta Propeller Repeat [Ekhidna lutea]
MKKVLNVLIMLMSLFAYAQSVPKLLGMADELYQNDRYLDAIEFYEKVVGMDKTNQQARFRLAQCYNRTLQYDKAKSTFLNLSNTLNHEYRARSLYSYANLLKQESRFEEADSIYFFLISVPDAEPYLVELSRKQREGCQLALRQEKADRGFSISFMEDINSDFHDFGAVLNPSSDHLVLATTRNLPGVQYEGSQYEGLLPDLASFERRNNNRWRMSSSEQRFSDLNTQWAEGSGSFTGDGRTFYFSSCRGESGADCGIMVSYLEGENWSEPVLLNDYINEPNSENKHPSISVTGDTLFFVSNRIGGNGGSDIWMSLKGLEKESWTPAINMGAVINSPENEITPYYSSAYECLLFASDGHVGYGGFDLYAAKGESFFEPEIYNLGDPFNSTWDDTYFAISDTVGFLSSNRVDHELLNIYSFSVNNEKLFLSLLISGESLIDSRLVSKFRDIQSLDLVTFRVEDYAGYDLFEPIRPSKPKPKILEDVVSGELGEIKFEHLYFDYASATLRPESQVALQELGLQLGDRSFESIDILAYTDSIGSDSANLLLSNNRGNSAKDFLVSLGIDSSRINVLPRGEIPSKDSDHWYKRILKRRVEVIIKSSESIDLPLAKTYILRQSMSLQELAGKIGVDFNELKKWNGNQEGKLAAGSTIRLVESGDAERPIKLLVDETDLSLFEKQAKDQG